MTLTRYAGSLLVAASVAFAFPAFARNTEHFFSAQEAAQSEVGQKHLLDVPFYMKGAKRPSLAKSLSEVTSNRSTSGAFRSDEVACRSAFLDALRTLQMQAQADGADAIVDIVSITRGAETSSPTDFRCIAGSVVVHVGLKGKLVKLK